MSNNAMSATEQGGSVGCAKSKGQSKIQGHGHEGNNAWEGQPRRDGLRDCSARERGLRVDRPIAMMVAVAAAAGADACRAQLR